MKSTLQSNSVLIIFYFLYLLILYTLFPTNFLQIIIIHGILIIIALTPLGESIMRLMNHTKRIKTKDDKDYLYLLFREVYESALEQNPKMNKNIKLFINEDKTPNAFACGNHTVCVTRGAILTFSGEELQGVLAHELGHLSNNDTRISMIFLIGNTLFMVFACFLNLIYLMICGVVRGHLGNDSFLLTVFNLIKRMISSLCGFIVGAIFSLNSRICERGADKFASDIGYGMKLKDALQLLKSIDMSSNPTIMDRIYASHPDLDVRIARLEQLEQIV